MWAIRILSGPQMGQSLELKMGRNLIGRAAHCDIKILSAGVSKEHSEIYVYKDRITLSDLKSSNGSFVNGVRVQNSLVRLGDKIGIHDVILDIVPAQDKSLSRPPNAIPPSAPAMANYGDPGGYQPPYQMPAGGAPMPQGSAPAYTGAPTNNVVAQSPAQQMIAQFQTYLDKVALPGVYKMAELFEFRWVLLSFVILFIFVTTILSMIPMMALSRASIMSESKRRAQSIARMVATVNQGALLQGMYSSLTTNSAESEEGVKQVLIVQQSDGMTLAPASRAGQTPDLPFVHKARREMRPQAEEVDSTTMGASFPIGQFDPNTGEQVVKAHAIVLYDTSSLAFDDGQAIGLFFQTLAIASVVGLIIFYFMYKLIEYPIVTLNNQLDIAMRDKKDSTEVSFEFPALQGLVANVNSLLTRYIHGEGGDSSQSGFTNKDGEAENLMQLIAYPAIAIANDGRVISSNAAFAQLLRAEGSHFSNQHFSALPDTAVQQNIEHLINKTKDNPRMIHKDQLEFSGHPCVLSCAVGSSNGDNVDYYVITVAPAEGGNS